MNQEEIREKLLNTANRFEQFGQISQTWKLSPEVNKQLHKLQMEIDSLIIEGMLYAYMKEYKCLDSIYTDINLILDQMINIGTSNNLMLEA